jgi:hypothetical protein
MKRLTALGNPSKAPVDRDKPFAFGITPNQFLELVKLATSRYVKWEEYDTNELFIRKGESTDLSDGSTKSRRQFISMEVPLKYKSGKYEEFGFVVALYKDGYLSYHNGISVTLRYENPLKVHEKIKELLTPR